MNVDAVVIDNKTYIEIDRILINGNTYAYLFNSINNKDFMIRKIVVKDGEIYYDGLKDKNEFDLAYMHFVKKHQNMLDENN